MTSRVGNTIKFNDSRYRTATPPMGIGLLFMPGSQGSGSTGAGYLFGGHSRPIAVDGVRNETVFWELCEECPLYKTQACSGGYKVLSAEPGTDRMAVRDESGNQREYRFNKEFCKMHYGTEFLRSALRGNGRMDVYLYPHFMSIRGGGFYWYLFQPSATGDQLEFMPHRIFNTWNSGQMCMGTTTLSDGYSVPHAYESFISSRMNRDLNPSSMRISEWIRSFSPQSLLDLSSDYRWRSVSHTFGRNTTFMLIPANYERAKFVSCRNEEVPAWLNAKIPAFTREITLPFVKNSDGNWFCAYDLSTEITRTNARSIRDAL